MPNQADCYKGYLAYGKEQKNISSNLKQEQSTYPIMFFNTSKQGIMINQYNMLMVLSEALVVLAQ